MSTRHKWPCSEKIEWTIDFDIQSISKFWWSMSLLLWFVCIEPSNRTFMNLSHLRCDQTWHCKIGKELNFLLWFIPQDFLDTIAPSFNQCRPIALSCHSANLSSVAFPMLLTPFLALSSLLPLCLCHQPSATSRHTCKPLPLPLLVLPPLEPLKSLFAQLAPYWHSASQRHHPVISQRAAAPTASNAWW